MKKSKHLQILTQFYPGQMEEAGKTKYGIPVQTMRMYGKDEQHEVEKMDLHRPVYDHGGFGLCPDGAQSPWSRGKADVARPVDHRNLSKRCETGRSL